MTTPRSRDRRSAPRSRAARRPTLADVAALAGVSAATVSFVVNGRLDERISPETQRRVLDAVARLGYRPNRAAQALRTQRTRTIAFVTDEIAVKAPAGQTISGAHDEARAHGNMLLIAYATREHKVLETVLDDLLDRQVDAAVYATVGTEITSLPAAAHTIGTVLVNCFAADEDLPCIVPDEEAGGHAAAQLAVAAGHRRVAYVAGDVKSWATGQRLAGYHRALGEAGITPDKKLVHHGNYRADAGYELTRQVLRTRDRPTAILCGNDLMALGAYFAAKEAGLRIPEDVSIVGYDDQEDLADDLNPPLTTVRLPHYEMGRWAVRHLIARSAEELPAITYAPCPVVERGSVGPAPVQAPYTGSSLTSTN